jgi:gentisate 1,2-dioxygenase
MFFEPHPDDFEKESIVPNDSPMHFPWGETQRRLREAEAGANGAASVEVALGEPALDTMALSMIRLRPGRGTPARQVMANSVFGVVEGEGTTEVEGEHFEWRRGDVIVVPAWRAHSHRSDGGGVLFRVTDEPVMQKLGFLREAGAAN